MISILLTNSFYVPKYKEPNNPPVTRTTILLKVASIALATLAFYTLQWRHSIASAGLIALTLSSVTWLSETYLRQASSFPTTTPNWFNTKSFRGPDLLRLFTLIFCSHMILGLARNPSSDKQYVQQLILKREPRILFLAVISAPICEEILFRGFLKERLEDACYLFSKFITPLSNETVQWISNIGQAIIFGYGHMHEKQTRFINAAVFILTSLSGFLDGWTKYVESTLISPIAIHMMNNSSLTASLLFFNR